MTQLNKEWIEEIKELLSTPKKIVLTIHFNPDGDSLGSSLALKQYLSKYGHQVEVVAPNCPSPHYMWMPGAKEMVIFSENVTQASSLIENADIIFSLDYNELSRTGELEEELRKSQATFIMIDHHPNPESFTKYLFSDPKASSASELTFEFIQSLNGLSQMKKSVAECLFTGIMTDTGLFNHNSNNPSTYRVVAQLLECGIDKDQIKYRVFDTNSIDRMRLMGYSLSERMVIESKYNTGYIYLTLDDLKRFNFKKGDHEGLVNYPLSVEGVRFSILIIEQEEFVKVSMRSKGNFDVNLLMREHFSGGGHKNAAGGRSLDNLKNTINKIEALLPIYKEELEKW